MSDLENTQNVQPIYTPVTQVEPATGFNFGELMTDETSAKDGVWVEFFRGSRLRIASTHSPSYKSKLTKLARANRLILDDSNPENYEAVQRITAEALASTVLLDWEGMHWPNPDGTVTYNVPYSPKLGIQALLSSDKFRDFVTEEAGRVANFKKDIIDAAKKP
jgi:hypothetical protein